MKKNLLALFALGAIYSASAQTTYVKDQAVVAVKPNTLLYMGNGLEISSSKANTIINEGNIQIKLSNLQPGTGSSILGPSTDTKYYFKNYDTDGSTINDGSNFVNTYTDATHYGQVMFMVTTGNSDARHGTYDRIQGKLTMQQKYANPANYNWLPISFPFTNDKVDNLYQNTFGLTPIHHADTDKYRYNDSYLGWDSGDSYYKTETANPALISGNTHGHLYILNLVNDPIKTTFSTNSLDTNARINYKGIPWSNISINAILNKSGVSGNSTWSTSGAKYTSTDPWSVWSERKAPSGERYRTFIGDSFDSYTTNSTTFGKYLINYGNPFTHNLDLNKVFSKYYSQKADLQAIQKVGSQVKWVHGTGNTTPTQGTLKVAKASVDGSGNILWTGDAAALILKPFEIVTIKLNKESDKSHQFYFTDNDTSSNGDYKTFAMTANGASVNGTVQSRQSVNDVSFTTNQNDKSDDFSNPSLYQLGLQISSKDGNTTNNVYFTAVNENVTGNREQFELDFNDFGTNSGFWLNQEAADGTYDNGSYLYINGFNMNDYVAKPLRITFYKNPKDTNTTFTLGANLAEGSTLNDGLERLSNGNKFYFVDTKENKSIEITKDFTYTFEAAEMTSDRFVVYWNALPKTLGTGEAEVNKNKTFIYKNNDSSNSIRFSKKNLIANISIYNMSGQLVLSKENVTTSVDYSINNLENGMYIVNIQYSDNTVETLKSIFKK
ncbi:T9SS type A sorting domain-containing protein [Empedobacter sp. GD03739]|uniref:T9SS type A sorting domain-containing protein n=1 Tax=Empedobacter sp. GD03739 TaxID=2975376 RepID=UPI00244AD69A|nr:T9SS type A sorting domain-containing protein [Empedobacter sp. GD03739]MDH1602024.1 T9SS type A sorting domain-containing protein [Empedobacter sp. GD03739]